MSKNKCRWCGVEAGKYAVSYSCGSWHTYEGYWTQGVACRDLGEQLRVQHEQTIEILQQRIDAAVKALQDITRHETEPDGVVCVFVTDLADVVEILTGNS